MDILFDYSLFPGTQLNSKLKILAFASVMFSSSHLLDLKAFEERQGGEAQEKNSIFNPTTQESEISDDEIRKLLFGEESNWYQFIEEEKLPLWIPSYSGKIGLGYSDNPKYGSQIREDSTYWELESEFFLLSQGKPNSMTYFYLFGEGKRFTNLPEHHLSGILLAQAEHTYNSVQLGMDLGIRLRHTYFDQVFDLSDLGLPYSLHIRSNKSEFIPHFSKELTNQISLHMQTSMGKEVYQKEAENNQENRASLKLEWRDHKSISFYGGLYGSLKNYKHRTLRNDQGISQVDKILDTSKYGITVAMEGNWDSKPLEEIKLELKYEELTDNGGGYYNYDKYIFRTSTLLSWQDWNLGLDLSLSNALYPRRSSDQGDRFEKMSFANGIELAHLLTEDWSVYLKWNREEDISNEQSFEYFSNFFSLGARWHP